MWWQTTYNRWIARKRSPRKHPCPKPPAHNHLWVDELSTGLSNDAQVSDGKERIHIVKISTLASGSQSIICPICEAGELSPSGHNGIQCSLCGYAPSHSVLEALRQIIALPDALGKHACEECGHPEMRYLPDGVSHCPGCGSEVLPTISKCRTQAVGTSRGHRQGSDVGIPDTVPAPKKVTQGHTVQAP